MIKVDMTSPDLDRQIELLKLYPEVLEKHFKPVLMSSVKALEARIRPNIPTKSGKAAKSFGSKVTGKGINLTGRVGWYDKNDPWYPNVLEYGARPHPISSGVRTHGFTVNTSMERRAANRKFYETGTHVKIGNRWVTMKVHPGFSRRGFMLAGFSAMKPIILASLAQANEGVVKDLALG